MSNLDYPATSGGAGAPTPFTDPDMIVLEHQFVAAERHRVRLLATSTAVLEGTLAVVLAATD